MTLKYNKFFVVVAFLFLASSASADTLYSNLGPQGALYQPDTYGLVAGSIPEDFIVSTSFSVSHNTNGDLDFFLPIFFFSAASNYPGFDLTLTDGKAVVWHGELFFPPAVTFETRLNACCGLFEVQVNDIKLKKKVAYTLTASPSSFNSTDFWYLNAQGEPGLLIQTPEPSTLLLQPELLIQTPEPSTLLLLSPLAFAFFRRAFGSR